MVSARQEKQLRPGQLVLARLSPAWPAMILKDADVPAEVLEQKPSGKVLPVVLLREQVVQYVATSSLSPLEKEAAVKGSKSKVKKILKEAFAYAATSPSYDEVVAELSSASSSPSPPPPPPPPAKKVKKEEEKGEEDDSEYVDSGSASVTETTDGEFDGKSLAAKQSLRFELCMDTRKALQEAYFTPLLASSEKKEEIVISDGEQKKINDLLDTLLATDVEVGVLRRAKLPRVVPLILKLSIDGGVREKLQEVEKMYNTPADPVIRGIPESLAPAETRETTEEPESLQPESNLESNVESNQESSNQELVKPESAS